MNNSELKELLTKLKKELEEVEEERRFVLGQTGMHIPGREIRKYEAEIDRLKAKIAEVEGLPKKTPLGWRTH